MTTPRRHNRPRRTIRDRLTPRWMSVYYGPYSGGFEWQCYRCRDRDDDASALGAGWTGSLAGARRRAKRHARKHFGMRAVYDPEEG